MNLRLPAYASEITKARQKGLVPARGEVIVSLDNWHWGKPRAGTLARCLVPAERAVDELDLRFLAGLDVLVAWSSSVTDGARVMALAAALLAVQPRRLMLLDMNKDAQRAVQWIKSVANGVEIQP